MDDAKRQHVENWLRKALHDLNSAKKLTDNVDPYYDTASYHCQQSAEKALKGFLVFHDQEIGRTHDLKTLIADAIALDANFNQFQYEAALLTPYATFYRYPDDDWNEPDLSEMNDALAAAQALFDFVLTVLPKETHPAAKRPLTTAK